MLSESVLDQLFEHAVVGVSRLRMVSSSYGAVVRVISFSKLGCRCWSHFIEDIVLK